VSFDEGLFNAENPKGAAGPGALSIPVTQELKDNISRQVFKITKSEAQAQGICVNCRQPALARCYSDAGRREYGITAMCEMCFDEMFGDE
jgi:hypothetical protein